jgi:hypothetical protein
MNLSTNESTKGASFFKSSGYKTEKISANEPIEGEIEEKLSEAKSILSKAKEKLRKVYTLQDKISLENLHIKERTSGQLLLDATLLACETRSNVHKIESEIRELKLLTCELLQPCYYRRNPYPHPWRQSRNYNFT